MKWMLFLLLSLQASFLIAAEKPKNWYDNFIFEDPTFVYQFVRALGYSYSGGADIGECIACGRDIQDKDIASWTQEWLKVADRLHGVAETFAKSQDVISARETYFRASQYFRSASFFLVAKDERHKSNEMWKKSVESFKKGISSLSNIELVKIPYENTTLPGYLIRSPHQDAPILIVNTGFDGTKEELYFEVGKAAAERGYNVLLMEGPGQGEVLRVQKLPFRFDWEKVISPTIDYLQGLKNVDTQRIALMGISMGGYLAGRAAAFEPRLAACILNGGIYDMSESFKKQMPEEVVALIETKPDDFNRIIEQEMKLNISSYWGFQNAMWALDTKTPAAVIKAFSRFNLKEVAKLIKCPTLVVDSEADQFFKGQPQEVYKLLKSHKTLIVFTAKEAAQAHCQVGAIAISNEKIFQWLDATLKWKHHEDGKVN